MSKIRYRFDDRTLMINNEVCAIITGFDKYAVSMSGNVYNIKTKRKLKPAYYSTNYNTYKRCRINLRNNGKNYNKYVHQLVAQEWLKETDLNPDDTPIVGKKCINHIDHDTTNNNVVNLEYCDYSYNNKHKEE